MSSRSINALSRNTDTSRLIPTTAAAAAAAKFKQAPKMCIRDRAANLDAIHDTVHEMARDEARHGKAFEGLLKRYFG